MIVVIQNGFDLLCGLTLLELARQASRPNNLFFRHFLFEERQTPFRVLYSLIGSEAKPLIRFHFVASRQ